MNLYRHNREAWDALVRKRQRHTRPARPEDLADPLAKIDPRGWIEGSLAGRKVLCLAAGGGYQSALFAATGAKVTVVDISPAMLELDRQMAAEYGFEVEVVETSMDDLSTLPEANFQVVMHPVATCYIPDVAAVYAEVARVTQPGGLYISQHKQPASLQADVQPTAAGYELLTPYYHLGPLPPVKGSRHREEGTVEFLHRWEQLIGDLCRVGFVVEDLAEPYHGGPSEPPPAPGSFAHRSRYVPPYVRIKARRTSQPAPAKPQGLWLPG